MATSQTSNSRNYIVGAVVIVMSAVFILEFGGPQAKGCTSEGGAGYAARVYGETITDGDFRSVYGLLRADQLSPAEARQQNLKKHVLDGLVERNLLAREARRVGFRVSEDDVMKHLTETGTIYLTRAVSAPQSIPGGIIPVDVRDEDGDFDMEKAQRVIRFQFRRSVEEFGQAQILETLAERMRETLRAGVSVSDGEVFDAYVREKERATIEYIRFSPLYYQSQHEPTAAEVQAWMTGHTTEVQAEFDRQRHRYTNLERQARARHILITVDSSATDADRTAARSRADALLARARRGEDFSALARENSEDTATSRNGGDIGYNVRGRMPAAFDTAMFAMQPGQISNVVTTPTGFHIIKLEGFREGNVPEAEAKLELATGLYRTAHSAELAHQAADATLAELRSGTTMEAIGARLSGRPAPAPGATPAAPAEPAEPAAPADPYAPKVQTTDPFTRNGAFPGDTGAIASAAFELTEASPLPSAPIHMGEDYIVFRLTEHVSATRADFSPEDRTRITRGLLMQKQNEAIGVRAASSSGRHGRRRSPHQRRSPTVPHHRD
jgi:peptidyl-prolyl cis-trans isomerase D